MMNNLTFLFNETVLNLNNSGICKTNGIININCLINEYCNNVSHMFIIKGLILVILFICFNIFGKMFVEKWKNRVYIFDNNKDLKGLNYKIKCYLMSLNDYKKRFSIYYIITGLFNKLMLIYIICVIYYFW